MGRYKTLIGPRLRGRGFAAQQSEAAIGVAVLNRMLACGRRIPSVANRSSHSRLGLGAISLRTAQVHQRHIGMDANTGEIIAAELTTNGVDDATEVERLLNQVAGPVASFTGDGAYDQDGVYRSVIDRDPGAAVVVPPRATAVLSETVETEPTQRDDHVQCIASNGRMAWQKASGYNNRSRVEATIEQLQAGDWRRATVSR